MHNNYYLLRHLTPALERNLKGAKLNECFSQNKDELILEFMLTDTSLFYIKAYLKSDFSCLSFPVKFERAKRNSVTLFNSILGYKVDSLFQFENDRSFSVVFSNDNQLLFKLHGNRSNIILFKNSKPIEVFKNSVKNDLNLDLDSLNRTLEISFENLVLNELNIRKVIPTLDKSSAQTFFNQLESKPIEEQSIVFHDFIKELNSSEFYIYNDDTTYRLSLIKPNVDFERFTNPIEALTHFFDRQIKHKAIYNAKSNIHYDINSQLVKASNYVIKAKQKLGEFSQNDSNQQKADVLMANMNVIKKGEKRAELLNFYTNEQVIINLNPLLSPQKNAERYYRKAKNESKEIAILKQNIEAKERLIAKLQDSLKEVEESENLKELKKWQTIERIKNTDVSQPYKEFHLDKYRILVGKNARSNDELTLKLAKKDDLWLHAKDVTGSHVVVKQIPGSNYPQYIIEKAAQLAAYYSKRKTDTLCPVLYTLKKFVRKPKGAPAGAVMVEKEKVILVQPSPKP